MTGRILRAAIGKGYIDRLCEHTYLTNLLGSDSTVLDLGANMGVFSHGMIANYHCRVVALEPLSKLRAGIAPSPRLTLLPYAAGGQNEPARLHVFGSRCASILRERDADEDLDFEEQIDVLNLKSILLRTGFDKIDLMKVDIEGAEIAMFATASDEDLCKCTQITIEFHDFLYPEQKTQVEAIKKRMRALGFWVINFSLDNTDVLFVNERTSGTGKLEYGILKYVTKYVHGLPRRFKR